jgi:hypothetical protein
LIAPDGVALVLDKMAGLFSARPFCMIFSVIKSDKVIKIATTKQMKSFYKAIKS